MSKVEKVSIGESDAGKVEDVVGRTDRTDRSEQPEVAPLREAPRRQPDPKAALAHVDEAISRLAPYQTSAVNLAAAALRKARLELGGK